MKKFLFFAGLFLASMGVQAQTWNIGTPVETDVTATLDNGTLTIRGTGAMRNWTSWRAPWYDIKDDIENLVIEEGVTTIGNFAFYECYGLTSSVIIPEGVTSIGEAAFGCCFYMPSVSIPNTVTTIGVVAFEACYNLTSVTIPAGVTKIDASAFWACYALSSITCSIINPLLIDSSVFNGVYANDCTLYVPFGSKTAYESAEVWKEFSIVELPPLTEITATTPTEDGVTIEWQSYTDVAGYKLLIYSNEMRTEPVSIIELDAAGERQNAKGIQRAPAAELFYTVEGLQSGTTYYYSLQSLGVGDVVLSNQSGSFTTDGTSSVVETWRSASLPKAYYSVTGIQLQEEPEKGVYIILYDNGKAEKRMR
ncbi:MAG: leucine-rich repeat domain-containing protein [Prevotellaceae bacterium]|jgi:hypothetical protein|nr:leucine-rich repeat domain-containing protein [Prevotellaceae bacterium]